MATAGLLAGTANFQVNGTFYRLAADAKYSVSTKKRETKAGMDGIHGFGETWVPGWIEVKLRDSGDLTVADFNDMTNESVTLELANGKNIVGSNMWTTEPQEVEATEATFVVRFESDSVVEDLGNG